MNTQVYPSVWTSQNRLMTIDLNQVGLYQFIPRRRVVDTVYLDTVRVVVAGYMTDIEDPFDVSELWNLLENRRKAGAMGVTNRL